MKTTRFREWFSPFLFVFLFSSRRLLALGVCRYAFGSQTTTLHSPAPVKAALAGAVSLKDVSKRRFRSEYSPPRYNAALTDNPRVVPLTLPAPASAVRRAQVRAEYPLSTRRRTGVRRERENGDRKTNYNQMEKPARVPRTGFNLKWRFIMRRVFTERKALTNYIIIHSFFGLCVHPRVVSRGSCARRKRRSPTRARASGSRPSRRR